MDSSAILAKLSLLDQDRAASKPAARETMLIAAQALVTSLQTPSEFISCIGWAEPSRYACVRIALDLKIFDTLNDAGPEGASTTTLAQPEGADVPLVGRIMKHLAAMNVVSELAPDIYASNHISSPLTEPRFRNGLIYNYGVAFPSLVNMPTFLAQTAYRQPINPNDGAFQAAHKTDKNHFPWLASNPPYLPAFASYMGAYGATRQKWFTEGFYPVHDRLISDYDTTNDTPFLVDVGGGKGHDLIAFANAYPDVPGRLVLQDLPATINAINPPLPSNIEAITHDFFTPQPESCRGARSYFIHSCIHNWDDDSCVRILAALKTGMTPGYSRLLIHDYLVQAKGASWAVTSMDIVMMGLLSARERTEAEFRTLCQRAGLTLTNVWVVEQGTEAIVEVMLLEE